MPSRKIALVGTAKSGAAAPYNDPRWEIWGVSARASYVTRADKWFELHRLDGEPQDWANNWRKVMKGFCHDIPEVVMMYPEPDLAKNVVQYPYQKIVDRFGTFFMTSTFSWMMALAIDELRPLDRHGVGGEIAIFGVDMEYGTEYVHQRTGFRHFFEICRVLGIPVTRLADSGLAFEPVPYPMWQDDPLLCKLALRNKETKRELLDREDSQRKICTMIAQDRAVLAELDLMKDGYDPAKRRVEVERSLAGLMNSSSNLSREIVYLTATSDEQSWLSGYLSP